MLSALAQEHEIVQNVLDYRGLVKLKNTYIDALPSQVEKQQEGFIPIICKPLPQPED